MASIHRKTKNGTWYITYRQDGRQRHRSLGTSSHRRALELKREVELVLAGSGAVELVVCEKPTEDPKNPTSEDFWTEFVAWAKRNRARSTVDEYGVWFRQFIEYARVAHLGDATRTHVEKFKEHLGRQGRHKPKGTGLQKVSVNNALRSLRSIWNHAVKLDLFSGDNPFTGVETHKIPQQTSRDYLERDEITLLFDAVHSYRRKKFIRGDESRNVELAIALMALAGLRKREVCFARWEWINWDSKMLTVSNHEEFTTKNRRERCISMHEDLIKILLPNREDQGYILKSTRASQGRHRYRADFKKSFKEVCAIAGIQATPHDLRHSFASRHAVKGRSLHVIAGWLGHSTTLVTERYAHFQKKYDADVNDM